MFKFTPCCQLDFRALKGDDLTDQNALEAVEFSAQVHILTSAQLNCKG